MDAQETKGRNDEQKLEELKKTHGTVYRIEVGDKVAYLKKPNRQTLSFASATGTKDPMKFNEIILKQCWIEGDLEIQTDDDLFLSVCGVLDGIIQVQAAKLEKF